MIISNLTAIFNIIKATWPSGIVFYNEEWTPLNDPTWRDPTGAPYPDKIPNSLDWISYDFCEKQPLHSACWQFVVVLTDLRRTDRLNNVSWLQPMCECEYSSALVQRPLWPFLTPRSLWQTTATCTLG